MRALLFTIASLLILVVALSWRNRGARGPTSTAAPLARGATAALVTAAAEGGEPAELLAPAVHLRSGSGAGSGAPQPGVARATAVRVADARAHPLPPTAWAAYDPRAERNARYRAESLPRALVGLTAEDIDARLRLAYAIAIETAAIFTELDERRESCYVPDDGQRHPLLCLDQHHSVACGGAHYVFAEGRFPLYDALVELEDASVGAPELQAWNSACPLEVALRSRSDEALERLAAYR